jgi:NAD(P)-dependent dehydrogenase (short-subunit alcohol dehydrogenase family)
MEAAIVAGVGPGLGSSLARAFAKEGYAVALISRHRESSEPVAEQIRSNKGKAIVLPIDVTQRQAVAQAVERAKAELGPVRALAYNASGYGRGAFLQLDPDQIRQAFDVGSWARIWLNQPAPDMLAGRGFISPRAPPQLSPGRAGFAPLAIASLRCVCWASRWRGSFIRRESMLSMSSSMAKL